MEIAGTCAGRVNPAVAGEETHTKPQRHKEVRDGVVSRVKKNLVNVKKRANT